MSLKFLAKKSWHTTNLKNVEQVWIAEQKSEEERRKVKFLISSNIVNYIYLPNSVQLAHGIAKTVK